MDKKLKFFVLLIAIDTLVGLYFTSPHETVHAWFVAVFALFFTLISAILGLILFFTSRYRAIGVCLLINLIAVCIIYFLL